MVASIGAVSSASAGASYYGADNYYARESGDPEPTAWFGRGAAELGLRGEVDIEVFERVLAGETLDGRRIGQRENEAFENASARSHRLGVDLTFSPPKDVSLLLYLGGDKRIAKAHRMAVDKALKWTERNLAATRIRQGKGSAEAVKTGKLVVAKFEHDISRDRDPQLHTHCVIANMTKSADGKWRALHNDPLFAHRKVVSLAYDAEMRQQMRALGYAVCLEDGKTGAYSVSGVPQAARHEFSQGARRVQDAADSLDHNTPKARDVLAVRTRPTKTQITQVERRAEWEARGERWKDALVATAERAQTRAQEGRIERPLDDHQPGRDGFEGLWRRWSQNFFRPTRTLRLERDDPYAMERGGSERDYAARAAVSFSLRHHEEREAAFSLHHVRRTALEHAADGVTLRDIDRELRLIRRSEKLMVRPGDPEAEATTRRSISHEERTRSLVAQAGSAKPLVREQELAARLRETRLTEGQKSAVHTILAGERRLVGVQGYAGTGKTTMMRHTAQLARDLAPTTVKDGYALLGLTPTHSARTTLEESAGIEARTVHGFLGDLRRGEAPQDMGNTVILVDEASFLSTKLMNALLERLIALKPARIVLSGDRRQHGAVEAGRPFDLAQRSGMLTAVMKDIVRMRDREGPDAGRIADQRGAVEAAARGRIVTAMKRLERNITEDREAPAGAAVAAWAGLPRERQRDALIVAPSHRLRNAINTEIRGRMVADGRLSQEATTIPVLQSRSITRAEATSPRSYTVGDKLLFHARLDAVNAKKDAVREVVHIEEGRGLVTLRNSKGGEQTISLDRLAGGRDSPPFSLNREELLELRRRDAVVFTRSDADKGIAAQDGAKVIGFDDTHVTLAMKGENRIFERNDPTLRSLTHGYAVTSHAAQGKTADDVISVIDSRDRALTSQVGFYVSISRTADTLALIVDDKDRVMDAVSRNTGINASALEAKHRIDALTGLDRDPVGADQPSSQRDADMLPDTTQEAERASQTDVWRFDADAAVEEPENERELDIGLDQDFEM